MSSVVLNMKYKIGYQFNWLLWYIVIYSLIMVVVYISLMQTSVISSESGSLFYRIWALLFFQLAISLKFKEDFDFLLTLSHTRSIIFQSMVAVGVVFSALLSFIIVLERVIVDYLNALWGFENIYDPFYFTAPYLTDNLLLQFIFFWMACIVCASFGLLMGSLSYRFGKAFILASWLVIGSAFILGLPWFLWDLYTKGQLAAFTATFTDKVVNFNLLISSAYLLLFSAVFIVAAYVNIRRLPQK